MSLLRPDPRSSSNLAPSAVLVAIALVGVACAAPQRWAVREKPTTAEAGLLLEKVDPTTIRRDYTYTELPAIPVRERLRPCCAFGSDIRATLAGMTIPGYLIPNIIGVEDIGPHSYDSGYVHLPSADAPQLTVNRENNGLIYTCRGGFIDTAHVRDYIDWSVHVGVQLARGLLAEERVEFALPDEGGSRRIILASVDPELVQRLGPRRLTIWLAEWITWKMSVWHEIATWYGFHSVPGFSEEASAFSPEDLYSNAIGVRLLPAIVYHHAERSESDFNGSVDQWLPQVIEFLGPVPREVGIAAAEAVDKLWWDSDARVPEKALVLRRAMDFERTVTPWLVPPSRMPAALREACGDAPEPHTLYAPDRYAGITFGDLVTLEIEVDDKIAKQFPFTKIGRTVTQSDFPTIVEAIREQNRSEFGDDADRPD